MAYKFYWPVLWEYRDLLLSGLSTTIRLSLATFLLSVPLAIIVALARVSRRPLLKNTSTVFIELFRNVPLVVQLFFWYFATRVSAFSASIIGLVLYSSAYLGEAIRSGVQSINRTQYDAAHSSGLSRYHIIRYVVLPQALMIVIPPMATELINIVKNSSLAMTLTVRELTFQTQEIDSITFRGFEVATAVTVLYLALSLVVVIITRAIETLTKIETKIM